MKLTYAEIPILALDIPQVYDFLNRSLPLVNPLIRPNYTQRTPTLLDLTLPNARPEQSRQQFKIGELFYPSANASRWMEFHCLLSQDQYDAIIDFIPEPQELVLDSTVDDSSTVTISNVYLLPPKPLAKFNDPVTGVSLDGLYLASFTDERFYFNAQTSAAQNISSWTQLIFYLALNLGISLEIPSISSVYGSPHPNSYFNSYFENAALMLDAAAWNCGLTVIRNFDGTYVLMDPGTSWNIGQDNRQEVVLAGGDFLVGLVDSDDNYNCIASILPASIQTAFANTYAVTGLAVDAKIMDEPYSRNLGTMTATDYSLEEIGFDYDTVPYTNTLQDLAEQYMDPEGNILNSEQTDALAWQLAINWYLEVLDGLDESYPGTVLLQNEGMHDITIAWTPNACYTRQSRRPLNYLLENIYFQHHFINPGYSSSSTTTNTLVTSSTSAISLSSKSSGSSLSSTGTNIIKTTCCPPGAICLTLSGVTQPCTESIVYLNGNYVLPNIGPGIWELVNLSCGSEKLSLKVTCILDMYNNLNITFYLYCGTTIIVLTSQALAVSCLPFAANGIGVVTQRKNCPVPYGTQLTWSCHAGNCNPIISSSSGSSLLSSSKSSTSSSSASSGSSAGTTYLCPCFSGTPPTVYANFSGGTCACLAGQKIPLAYIGGGVWQNSPGSFTPCGGQSSTLILTCQYNTTWAWTLGGNCYSGGVFTGAIIGNLAAVTCLPSGILNSILFSGVQIMGSCGSCTNASVNIEITTS